MELNGEQIWEGLCELKNNAFKVFFFQLVPGDIVEGVAVDQAANWPYLLLPPLLYLFPGKGY